MRDLIFIESGPCSLKKSSPVLQAYPPSSVLDRACVWGIAFGATFSFLVLLFGILRWRILVQEAKALALCKPKPATAVEMASKDDEMLFKKSKEPLSINIATFEHSLLRLCPADVLTATENFSKTHIIGDGGFGIVYKGLLPEGRTIAVKRLNGGHFQGDREFLAEMETIGKVKYENLVPLLGYCVYGDERFLIYEYMENGSLDMWLRNRADAVETLDWPVRFNIWRAPTGQADMEGGNLVGWVRCMTEMGSQDGVLDPCIPNFGQWKSQMLCVLAVARACTLDEPWKRPDMLEVVKQLKEIKLDGCGQ
ncbi:Leucine-rich repeat receptor protein kinase msp1 [Thalictrum thalictroides]|uniref:non-specific serine/threonine protein kinase n=1 Tax=Thalictrum thalictroides TaxID=46969 RepID=A0A7J6VJH5_THATH|nr:Leucine-rich repeat receptor protein kinase msp1 [Thalictrum thalictroides]